MGIIGYNWYLVVCKLSIIWSGEKVGVFWYMGGRADLSISGRLGIWVSGDFGKTPQDTGLVVVWVVVDGDFGQF